MHHLLRRLVLPGACLLTLTAVPAAAQHCWPVVVAVVLRGEDGAVLDPSDLDLTYAPDSSDTADFRVEVRTLPDEEAERIGAPGARALTWYGRGRCRVDLDTLVVRRGGGVMRLLPNLHLNSLQRPGPSEFLIDTPPFSPDTFVLDPLPRGTLPRPTPVPASAWRRVDGGADAGGTLADAPLSSRCGSRCSCPP